MTGARRVLVVDDDPAIRRILSLTLELEGYEIETADDGEAALEAISRSIPDAVVLDVMMPKLDGLEVLQRMRSSPRTAEVPVIILTARTATEDVWEGWRRGVDYYMTKPFDVEDLLRFMEHIFGREGAGELPGQDSPSAPQ